MKAHLLLAAAFCAFLLPLPGLASPPDLDSPLGKKKPAPAKIPPHAQSFRRWTVRQAFTAAPMMGAPGGNIHVIPTSQPVRLPFLVVTLKDSPQEMRDHKAQILDELRQRIFARAGGPGDSLQDYFNQLFKGKLTFFDPSDILEIELNGFVEDYFVDQRPNRKFLTDVAAALARQNQPLEIYNNRSLKQSGVAPASPGGTDQELDLVPIFVLARADQGLWAMRMWSEWTADQDGALPDPPKPIYFQDSVSHAQLALSSYCIFPLWHDSQTPQSIGLGFVAHELLHGFGLPDTYDRTSATAGCGCWCAMSWGMYGGIEAIASTHPLPWVPKPVWPGAWCRDFLHLDGDIKPLKKPGPGDAELFSPLDERGPHHVRLDFPPLPNPVENGKPCAHYLLVEFRGPGLASPGTYDWDSSLPHAGFLVWEVNETIGRKIGDAANDYWPSAYTGPGQNDSMDAPLVGLCRPEMIPAKNLNLTETLKQQHLWGQAGQVLEHPAGIILSDFRIAGNKGSFHYVIKDPAVSAPVPPTAGVPPSAPSAPSAPAAAQPASPSPPAPALHDVKKFTGTPKKLSPGIPSAEKAQLSKVFSAYPKFTHSFVSKNDRVASLVLPASIESKASYCQNVDTQIDLLGNVIGDPRTQLLPAYDQARAEARQLESASLQSNAAFVAWSDPALASAASVASFHPGLELSPGTSEWTTTSDSLRLPQQEIAQWYGGSRALSKDLGVKVGDELLRVTGSRLAIQREGSQRDRLRYLISQEVQLPELPSSLQGVVAREDFKNFITTRFPTAIDARAQWELVIENGTGKLKWQCRIPTVPTSGPVTLEVDARPPGGLTEQTPIEVK